MPVAPGPAFAGVVRAAALVAVLMLSACLSTKVSSLAPNMVRLDMKGVDAPSDQEALKSLMLLGAKETLARGYQLFRFIDWAAGPTQMATPGQPAAANFEVTVVMFRVGEQGNNPVFDARAIMQTQQPQQ